MTDSDIAIGESADPEIAAHFKWASPDGLVTANGDIALKDGRLTIVRCNVESGLGLTARAFREVPLPRILAEARASAAVEEYLRRNAPAPPATRDVCHCADSRARRASDNRQPLTPEFLRTVALAYIEETGPGKAPGVNGRMAQRFGRPEGTVRTWLARSRAQGWLGPGSQGRRGAVAGPRLLTERQAS